MAKVELKQPIEMCIRDRLIFLTEKDWSRSIGCSSDVKIGVETRLQASLTRLTAPIFSPSELLRKNGVSDSCLLYTSRCV